MTGVAVCGLGNIGAVHLTSLAALRGCRVAGVYDARPAAAAGRGVRAYRSFAELLDDPAADAVVVATPSDTHRELTLAALAAGKHVFVEKPLAGTLADARAIAAAAAASGRVVQVGFCERFNPAFLEAKHAVAAGRVGRVRAVHASRLAPYELGDPGWELGVLDTAVHDLDLILWLVGERPAGVRAAGARLYPDSDMCHSVTTTLRFAGGAVAVDHTAWVKGAGHPLGHCSRARLTVLGDAGLVDVDLTGRPAAVQDAAGYRLCDTVILGGPGYSGCLKHQLEAFLAAVEGGGPVLAPAADALLAEEVALAAAESLRTGDEVLMGGVS